MDTIIILFGRMRKTDFSNVSREKLQSTKIRAAAIMNIETLQQEVESSYDDMGMGTKA